MRHASAYAEALAPVTSCMLDQARIESGQRVLDLGSGAGDMALLAAGIVGSSGFVLATDISLTSMGSLAARIGLQDPPPPIAIRECAAEDLAPESGTFDVALARNCVMYFRDLDRALGNVHRALRRGGRLVLSVYGPLQHEPFHAIPVAAVTSRHPPPAQRPDYIQAFRVGAAEVRAALVRTGFTGLVTQVVPVWRSYPDLVSALETLRRSTSLGDLISVVGELDRDEVWDEIALGFGRYQGPDGLRIPGEQVVIVGTA